MIILNEFLFFFMFLIICLSAIICESSFSDYENTRINWISSKEIDLKNNENVSKHIYLIKMNAKKHSEENVDILKHLQSLHIPEKNIQDKKDSVNDNFDRKHEIGMEAEKGNVHMNITNIRRKANKKPMSEDNKMQIENYDESFIEVAKGSNKSHHKSKETNRKNNNDSTDSVGTDNISEFVDFFGTVKNDVSKEALDDEIEDHPASEDVYDETNNSMHIYNGDKSKIDLYKKYKDKKGDSNMRMQKIESIEYIGAGYDVIFGNPSGDPFLKVDPGYRDSIIKLTYPKSDDDFPDKYKNKNPNGSYVRNEISCNRFEQEHEITSMSEYTHELSSDTNINVSFLGFSLFSASFGYKKTSKVFSKNREKMFMLKSYCFQYVASLSSYGQWEFTDQFNRAVTMLPSYFNSLEHDGTTCKVSEFRIDPEVETCGPSVRKWLQFFKSFGTHVSTLLHLGGKITQIVKTSKSETKSSKSESFSSNVSSGFLGNSSTTNNTSTTNNKESKSSSKQKETIIIGGKIIFDPNEPKEFEKWANSVREYPMPIKGEYEPLSKVLPTRLNDSFKDALEFYITLYGFSPYGRSIMHVDVEKTDLRKRLRETIFIISNDGPGMVTAKCPKNTHVIAGFVFSVPRAFKVIDNLEMSTCKVDESSCSAKTNDFDVYNNVFAICAEDPLPFMDQIAVTQTVNSITMKCENRNQIILWGFGFIYTEEKNKNKTKKLNIKSCKYGKNSCTIEAANTEEENNSTHITGWIVCAHEDYNNTAHTTKVNSSLTSYNAKHNLVFQQLSTGCINDLLFTIALTISETQFENRQAQCFQAQQFCSGKIQECIPFKKTNAYYSVVVY